MSQDKTQTNDAQNANQTTGQKSPETAETNKVEAQDFATQTEAREPSRAGGQSESQTSFVQNITSKSGLLSALSATLLVLVVPVLIYLAGTGMVTFASITGLWAWTFVSIFGMAAVRLFGKDSLKAIQQARGKK